MLKRIIGRKVHSFYRHYSIVPGLMFLELRRILAIIRHRIRYADDPEVLLSGIRMRAHIVDKGLQVDNWEVGRSRAHYLQLCNDIEKLKDSSLGSDPSFKWALQKKAEYENAQIIGRCELTIKRDPLHTIAKEDLVTLMRNRRSIRTFENRQIPDGILRELADVIKWSPTSCNRQPARLFITQNPEKVAACLQQCVGATCFGDALPSFIAVCADTRFYTTRDRNLPFIDVSLGVQNMLLLAHAQGIEGTILNWLHHTTREEVNLRAVLEIPEYYLIAFNLIIGYPAKSAPVPGRKGENLAYCIVR